MVLKKYYRTRHLRWLLLNRIVFFFCNLKNKNFFWFFKKFFIRNFLSPIGIAYYVWRKKKIFKEFYPNVNTYFKNKCLICGKSRGIRFMLNRLTLLTFAYKQDISSIGSARW